LVALIGLVSASVICQEPDSGPHLLSQAAADVLRQFAGADAAFLPAGSIKGGASRDNLASLLNYPSDNPVVVTLSGSQVRQAIERSISLYPQPSVFFLQLSGFEVTFKRDPQASPRIVSLTANGAPVDNSRKYSVAMSSSLARGALGYFKIWDKDKITKTFDTTMEAVLKGKRYTETSPRYTVVD
jgi:2',3'-cyclic-nucleotide 2'-phosphodiesterase (5'-nucleotidase family)